MLLEIISGIILVGSITFTTIFILRKGKYEKMPINLPIIQNYLSSMIGGYFDLLQIGLEEGHSGRLLVYGLPKDLYYSENEDIKRKIIKIPIPEENYKVIPPGRMSKRTHIILLPKHSNKLTSSPEINDFLGGLIDNAKEQRILLESSIKSYENITQQVKNFALGEMSTIQLNDLKRKIEMLYERTEEDRKRIGGNVNE